ncbi:MULTISPECIES: TonB-dependent receptor [unclassified Thalassolituus]|uniref:TonB-dependent receptor n=1 Tax=unclassified Thalassolituus TaxID=2624967 RepID=UPI0025F40472|nr:MULTISPECIES: TonB-dependent receptor [unclassified Thalassolituus]
MLKKISVAIALVNIAPSLHAHTTELDTVVVSSAGQDAIADVAQPVTVLDRDAIDENQGDTLGTLLENQPGISNASFGPGVGRPVLRGMGGSRVKLLVDGVNSSDVSAMSSDHAPMADASASEQLEVIQGPATLLYGGGAIGGVVNLIDRRISEQGMSEADGNILGEVSASYRSNDNAQNIQARTDMGNENWVLHLDGFSRSSDNYQTDGEDIENTDTESSGGSVALSRIGMQGFIGMSVSTLSYDYGVPNEENEDNRVRPDQTRYDIKGAWQPLNSSWLEEWRTEINYTDYEHDETDEGMVVGLFDKETTSLQTRLRHQMFAGWQGSIGLQASKQTLKLCHDHGGCSSIPDYSDFAWDGSQGANLLNVGGYNFAHSTPMPETDTTDFGLYWVEKRRWQSAAAADSETGGLGGTVEFGARADQRKIELDPDTINPAHRQQSSYYDDTHFTPLTLSAASTIELSDTQIIGLSLARAQRAPDAEEMFWNGDHHATFSFQLDNPDLKEETAYTLDINWRYTTDSDSVRIALYHYEYEDYIYNDLKGFADPLHGNFVYRHEQADARFNGGEFSWQHIFNANWHLDLNADYVRAKLNDGGNLPRIAPASALLAINWQHNLWQARLENKLVAEQSDTAENETSTDSYNMVNASVSRAILLGDQELKVRAAVNNLTDEVARNHVSYLKEYAPLPGRSLQLGVNWSF